MKRHDKKTRVEKQKAFQERVYPKRKVKVCKITKGEHLYTVPYKETGLWNSGGYNLKCACGKQQWKYSTLRPLKTFPKFMVCKKHGWWSVGNDWRNDSNETKCWACQLGLEPFEKK